VFERPWQKLIPEDAAVNLAVFRVAVGALLLLTHEVWTAAAWR
jgi:hypothetical protein